jgi:hypothetical protein
MTKTVSNGQIKPKTTTTTTPTSSKPASAAIVASPTASSVAEITSTTTTTPTTTTTTTTTATTTTTTSPTVGTSKLATNYVDQVVALYDFQSTTPETIGFQKDSIINIIEKSGDWWLGELNGKIGLLPYNYVQSIAKTNG